jgi:hypothetical protein
LRWRVSDNPLSYRILDSRSFRLFLMTQTAATLTGPVALLLFGNPGNAQLGKPPMHVEISELDSYVANLITFAMDLIKTDTAENAPPRPGERDRAAIELFSKIAAAHHGTEKVEGLAKVGNIIGGAMIIMRPGHDAEQDPGYDPETDLPRPSRLLIASPLYVATTRHR